MNLHIGQEVSWKTNIHPFFPDTYQGHVFKIAPSPRYEGEYTLTIQTDLGEFCVSTLDPEYKALESVNDA